MLAQWPHMASWTLVNIVAGTGLAPDGTKPLNELVSEPNSDLPLIMRHSLKDKSTGNTCGNYHYNAFENYTFKVECTAPGGKMSYNTEMQLSKMSVIMT